MKKVAIFIAIFCLTAYCATKPQIKEEDEKEVLRSRVHQYWQYQTRGKIDIAYQFEAPAYRENVPILSYLNRFKLIKYLEAEVLEIGIKGDEGNALVKLKYRVLLKHISETDTIRTNKEKWVKIENIWYHIPEDFRS